MLRSAALPVVAVLASLAAVAGCGGPEPCGLNRDQRPCADGIEVGESWDYSLLTHCTPVALFDGRWWTGPDFPLEARSKTDPSYTDGRMTLVEPDLAVFEANGASIELHPEPADFVPPTCA